MRCVRWILCISFPLVPAACSDEPAGPSRPITTPAAALRLTAPATVVVNTPFNVTVEALTAGGERDVGFAGTVELISSAGTLSRATVQLSAGTATVSATISGTAGEISLEARAGNAGTSAAVLVLSGEPVVSLDIVPAAVLLTTAGEARQLVARARDAHGRPTSAQVTWSSTHPDVAGVDGAGKLTAEAFGSSYVTATAQGVSSIPVLVLVVQPASGAVLVADSQIVSAPVPVDAAAPYAVGWQYRLRVRGSAPAAGQLIMGTGGIPLAGRVVSSVGAGADHDVVVRVVPLRELFADLQVSERVPLIPASSQAAGSRPYFRQQAAPGAASGFTQRGGFGAGAARLASSDPYRIGPFACEAEGEFPVDRLPLTIHQSNFTTGYDLDLDLQISGSTLQRLVVSGTIDAEVTLVWEWTATVSGEVDCGATVWTQPLPVAGVLSWFIGGQVPLGVAFTLGAEAAFSTIGYDAFAQATARVSLGLEDCATSCRVVGDFSSSADGYLKPQFTNPLDDFRVELSAGVFATASLSLGSPLSRLLQYEALKGRGGLELVAALAFPRVQANDATYASSVVLRPAVKVAPDTTIRLLVEILGADVGSFMFEPELNPIASTPQGSFTVAPGVVRAASETEAGDTVSFIINLAESRFLGSYAVDSLLVFRRLTEAGGGFAGLERLPLPCGSIAPVGEQEVFTCRTVLPDSLIGEQTFYAFIKPRLFGAGIPIPLEIAQDAAASVRVTDDDGSGVFPLRIRHLMSRAEVSIHGHNLAPVEQAERHDRWGDPGADSINFTPFDVTASAQLSGSWAEDSTVAGDQTGSAQARSTSHHRTVFDRAEGGSLTSVLVSGTLETSASATGTAGAGAWGGAGSEFSFEVRGGAVTLHVQGTCSSTYGSTLNEVSLHALSGSTPSESLGTCEYESTGSRTFTRTLMLGPGSYDFYLDANAAAATGDVGGDAGAVSYSFTLSFER